MAKDNSGLSPIFYATTPEMVKLIRLNCKGARDQVDNKGLTARKKALKAKNFDLLNALISPNALRRFVTEINAIQRGLLFKFVTGLNALPAEGFEGLKGKMIEIDGSLEGKLPTSSTCSFTLKLAPFSNYEIFSINLLKSIEWTSGTDNEAGLSSEDEGIELGFDSDGEDQNGNGRILLMSYSESDVSDIYFRF